MPGGDTRTTAFFPPFPLALERGAGCYLWDVDGNQFIDFVNNYAILVHGNSPQRIVDTLLAQVALGTGFPGPTRHQEELAVRLCNRFTSIDSIRFTASGTEAVMSAVRAARVFTGRDQVVKADGGYHGSWEQLPMSLEISKWARGTPAQVRELLHVVRFNDCDELEGVMTASHASIAAIILEPVLYAGGIIRGSREYVSTARRLADEYGALVILDEVITSRLQAGGYQETLGVKPDLTVLGKPIGGGLPIGAVGGRKDILALFDPTRANHIAQAGSYNGNPLAMVAGCVALDMLTQSEISRINALGERLAEGLRQVFASLNTGVAINVCGSLIQLHFGKQKPEILDYRELDLESEVLSSFHRAALEEGVYLAPRGMLNVSTAMDQEIVEDALSRLGRAAEKVARMGI